MADPSFRPLVQDDLPLLHRWLNEPGVVRWWEGEDVSWDAVVRDYWTEVDDHVEHWIAEDAGTPFGWIQCWDAAAEHADDADGEVRGWLAAGIELDGLCGIDYLVGDPGARGSGRGARMIDCFVRDVVFADHPDWTVVAAGPYLANEASWRALARAGFDHHADLVHDSDPDQCRLMVRQRHEIRRS